jgi:hypothetical protein
VVEGASAACGAGAAILKPFAIDDVLATAARLLRG